ncbi:Solvent efflux pump periplasmic linker SrpA [Halioglobus japonicus]|nr:Solvent efflux pump periplasmic linker SrpA [Halioglobus japonicus]
MATATSFLAFVLVAIVASRKKQIFVSVALLAISTAITFTLYLNRPPAKIAEPEYQPVTVDVAVAVKERLRIEVQAQGTVTPMQETSLLSEVNGRIIEASPSFAVGGFVSKGEILVRIDPRDYETNLLRAEAALKSAQSNLAQEKGRAQVAEREWQRLPKGSQRSQEAKDLYLRKPQLDQAQAQMLAAQADLNTARDNLERTNIRAPYDALIRAKHVELGQFVAAGSPLADIFSVDYAEIRLPIPQSKLAYLELPGLNGTGNGSPIDVYTDVGGEIKHWTAQLHRTEGVFDERSRVLYAVARIKDPYAVHHPDKTPLRIGTFVNANIQGKEFDGIVTLPRFVMRAGNNLWVIDDSGHLHNRQVTLLRTGGDLVYISEGLDEGDRVSLTTLDSSFDSSEVIIESSTPSNKLNQQGRPIEQPGAKDAGKVTASVEPSADDSEGG